MQHSSQVTKEEYANKHETEITTKMANIWERRIGTDKVHTSSPTSVATPSSQVKEKDVAWDVKLTKAGTESASGRLTKKKTMDGKKNVESKKKNEGSQLARKSTMEIVEGFEKMKKEQAEVQNEMVKKEVVKKEDGGDSAKREVYDLIARLAQRLDDAEQLLKEIKDKVGCV